MPRQSAGILLLLPVWFAAACSAAKPSGPLEQVATRLGFPDTMTCKRAPSIPRWALTRRDASCWGGDVRASFALRTTSSGDVIYLGWLRSLLDSAGALRLGDSLANAFGRGAAEPPRVCDLAPEPRFVLMVTEWADDSAVYHLSLYRQPQPGTYSLHLEATLRPFLPSTRRSACQPRVDGAA